MVGNVRTLVRCWLYAGSERLVRYVEALGKSVRNFSKTGGGISPACFGVFSKVVCIYVAPLTNGRTKKLTLAQNGVFSARDRKSTRGTGIGVQVGSVSATRATPRLEALLQQ